MKKIKQVILHYDDDKNILIEDFTHAVIGVDVITFFDIKDKDSNKRILKELKDQNIESIESNKINTFSLMLKTENINSIEFSYYN